MTNDPKRTDYMPTEEFARRALEQTRLGYKAMGQTVTLNANFDTSFDQFAANVAHGLRHYVVYRSDGGAFARGLVRASQDLGLIHRDYLTSKLPNGTRIALAARLYRRQHMVPSDRWMMSVRFAKVAVTFGKDEAEIVRASPAIIAKSDKILAEKVLDHAIAAAYNPRWSGDRQKRIIDWVILAAELDYPAYLDLWYYNRVAVFEFVNWNTLDKRRADMTRATGGKLPFSGTTGSMGGRGTFSAPPDTPWREYPFRNAIKKCRGRTNVDDCAGLVGNELKFAESEIFQSIREMEKQIKRAGMAANQDPFQSPIGAASDAVGASAAPFFKHVLAQLKDPKSLYATYMKYSQASTTIWDTN
ncbi:hypothetical protein [Phreatobacter stygius]|uniref:Uncharacterized protein n=1 Tax=Phreatobacter stygius TaxID=1940610 RepID=A0A4D7BCB9_9HYPH|nr:hypothetical protein [Phreatobacter stygius]QCI67688.1 hypothetical protein E8M01_27785 [Phreatobacter stygius]